MRVLKAITAVDAGRVVNPMITDGQIQGSTAQALGMGMCEEMIYDQKGTLLTTNLRDYRILNTLDMPEMQTYMVETMDPGSSFGVKAVGEVSLHGMAPALANAVSNALGVRVRQIPLTPERLLRLIHAQGTKS
jgi:putative selenate reductase molybdopterin-binding subunit